MIERYHLELAVVEFACGLGWVLLGVALPAISARVLAVSGLTAAVLATLEIGHGWWWVAAAAVAVIGPDDSDHAHPLGRFAAPLAVVALAGIWSAVPDTEAPLAAGAVLVAPTAWLLAQGRAPGRWASAALCIAVVGAALTGSAGWGAAMATAGVVGLIASAPLVCGFGVSVPRTTLAVLVTLQGLSSLVLPRMVMGRSAAVAVGVMVLLNAILVLVLVATLGWPPRSNGELSLTR